jgi:carboxymethylenebutenolidase
MRRNIVVSGLGVGLLAVAYLAGCANNSEGGATSSPRESGLPPGALEAVARLQNSPRHGEWVTVKTGASDSVRAWLVYPERRSNAPVVVVIHEIYGLSNWVRGVADQLAADGFIAIAPDLLTSKNVPQTADGEPDRQAATAAIRTIQPADYQRQINEVAKYAMNLPAALKKYGVVGYCWGGSAVFNHAAFYPEVNAVVSYYGGTPAPEEYAKMKAPVLGLYGENDQRVNSTVPRADSALKSMGKTYEYKMFPGAGHGFLRAQEQPANLEATKQAWPMTVAWFRKNLR